MLLLNQQSIPPSKSLDNRTTSSDILIVHNDGIVGLINIKNKKQERLERSDSMIQVDYYFVSFKKTI